MLEAFGVGSPHSSGPSWCSAQAQRALGYSAGGVELGELTNVPFGLAVGALTPHELEGVLVMIGVVGIQLTLDSTQTIAKALPFWGPQRLIQHSIDTSTSIGAALPVEFAYTAVLLAAAMYIVHLRAGSTTRLRAAGA